MPQTIKRPKPKPVHSRSTGRQPDAPLSPKLAEKLDELVAKATATAVAEALKSRQAPSVHTDDRRDRRDYLDDQARETVGDERMERRRQTEMDARQGYQRPEHSPSVRRRQDDAHFSPRHRHDPTGMLVAEYIGWMTRAAGDVERAHRFAKRDGGSSDCVRALGESVFTAGGAIVPQNVQSDFIALLYNTAVYLKAGPQQLTLQNGNLTLPKMVSGASGNWLGESQNITPGQQTFGQVRVDLRNLAVITPASNIFLRDSGPSAINMIREDLSQWAAQAIDIAALRSLGTEWKPKGLRGWVPTANTFASTGATAALITADIMHALRLLEEAKMPMGKLAIFASPRTKYGLMALRDGLNNPIWADELGSGKWYGMDFFSTQNIPNNVGSGGNKSEIYIVDMSQQIFAEDSAGVRIDVSDGAAYYDGSAVVSGFSRDETAVRLIQRCDIVSRQGGNDIVEIYDVAVA
jgi:HK97 family phage major capsid protein